MTAADLRDLFVTILVRQAGGNRRAWRLVVGDVKVYTRFTHPHCNWSITPTGTIDQVETAERVADDLRASHPIIGWPVARL